MNRRLRNSILGVSSFLLGLLTVPVAANAASYPNSPLTYMVPFNPGGESDITARIQEVSLKKHYGNDVVITYKPGGGGAVGWSELVRSKADGYTISGHNFPHIILQPMMRGNAGYKTKQLKQVYIFESTPNALVVNKKSNIKSFADFVKAARKGVITVGGSGSNTANDLGTTMLKKATKTNLIYIPFTGSGAAIPSLLGGHVKALMTYSSQAVKYKNKFRVLAIAAEERMKVLPNVPTFKELGYNIVEGAYRGVVVPPGTPDSVVNSLADTFEKVMKDPSVVKKMDENGFKIEHMRPAEANKFVDAKIRQYRNILKELGLLRR